MVIYLNLADIYEKRYDICDMIKKVKNKAKVIIVELGAYDYVKESSLYNMYSEMLDKIKEIEKVCKEFNVEVIHYNIEDEEISKSLSEWGYTNILLLFLSGLFAVLLIPIDVILRFVFKKKELADKVAYYACKPAEIIIQRKTLSNLDKLKKLIKSIEDQGEQVIVIHY